MLNASGLGIDLIYEGIATIVGRRRQCHQSSWLGIDLIYEGIATSAWEVLFFVHRFLELT